MHLNFILVGRLRIGRIASYISVPSILVSDVRSPPTTPNISSNHRGSISLTYFTGDLITHFQWTNQVGTIKLNRPARDGKFHFFPLRFIIIRCREKAEGKSSLWYQYHGARPPVKYSLFRPTQRFRSKLSLDTSFWYSPLLTDWVCEFLLQSEIGNLMLFIKPSLLPAVVRHLD